MKLLTLLCVLLQVADGILTGYGVTVLPAGLEAEGNTIVKEAMYSLGVIPALVLIKSAGIFAVIFMYRIKTCVEVMFCVFGFYSLVVVVWIATLFC